MSLAYLGASATVYHAATSHPATTAGHGGLGSHPDGNMHASQYNPNPIPTVAALRGRLSVNPARPDDWYELARLLKQSGQYDAALDAYAQAIRYQVSRPEEVYLNCAVIHTDHLANHAAAEDALRLALRLNPDYLPAWLNLGNLCEEQGRRDEAQACYERILNQPAADKEESSLRLEALARYVQLRPACAEDPWLRQLEATAASTTAAIDHPLRANLHFALGRVHERMQHYDTAFSHYELANEWARRDGRRYDPAASERWFDTLMETGISTTPDTSAEASDAGLQPLFICGMFRSGSTLIEQVLHSHPQVAMGGELAFFPRLAAGPLAPYPNGLRALDSVACRTVAAQYRELMRRLLPPDKARARYFSDKRPDNFMLLGLIKRVFPAARIIHTTRDPLDNGLSIYQQHLDQRVAPYSSDLAAIGHFYGQYRRLMRRFEQAFAGDILSFDYDDFVASPEPALRRLLDFLQLPWEPRCLDFHRQESTVKTASYWQVRRPLYREASGRWRHYARHLAPLQTALAAAAVPLRQDD